MPFLVEVKTTLREYGPVVRSAAVALSRSLRQNMRQDIARAGHFGKYAKGLTTAVETAPKAGGYIVNVFLRPSFLKVEEYGGVSVGKPLLWIPAGRLRIKLRNYGGKLIRPKGRNILVRPGDGRVMYIGVSSVTHKPRFHLRDIAQKEAEKFLELMRENAGSPVTRTERAA